jgi:hypothetical protein
VKSIAHDCGNSKAVLFSASVMMLRVIMLVSFS